MSCQSGTLGGGAIVPSAPLATPMCVSCCHSLLAKFCCTTAIVYRAADELKNEAKAHILNHVNVVTLHAIIFEPEHYGIVLEFVPQGCLDDVIYRNKVLHGVNYVRVCFDMTIQFVFSQHYELAVV